MNVIELRPKPFVPDDGSMTKRYLSLTQFAAKVEMTTGALNTFKNLPAPDVVVGEGPRATRGWSEKTIEEWNAARRGPGNWGAVDRGKKK